MASGSGSTAARAQVQLLLPTATAIPPGPRIGPLARSEGFLSSAFFLWIAALYEGALQFLSAGPATS